ncbi:MAG: putative toxin-antitoxin system toxin component, PIN family [Nitrospira sp.]|nr:putative toxin-antitoxin system toxin component, PIN family [Nitrospira sp.]
MSPPRIVIDTNVLLSSLLFHAGTLSWIRAAWQARRICPLVSRETTNELIRALGYPKFNLIDGERDDLLADYLPWCETVIVSTPAEIPQCRDPFDRPFLELALVAQADALVTGDKDLLAMVKDFPVPIITARAFRKHLPTEGRLD